ncbi:MAG: DUF1905 domain-containing protein [Bacteroidia bacterium]
MQSFTAKIFIIGVNPYVFIPEKVLAAIFKEAKKDKGPIPVHGTLDGHKFIQTLVKYSGHWRLYLNMPMRKAVGKDVGDIIKVKIAFDPRERKIEMHPTLKQALQNNKAAHAVFKKQSPSRQKEIVRYISFLKNEEAVVRNVARAIKFLEGKERFVGRDKP